MKKLFFPKLRGTLAAALILSFIVFQVPLSSINAQTTSKVSDSLNKVAENYVDKGEFDSALFAFNHQLDFAKKENKQLERARITKRMGFCYEYKGDYDKALGLLYEALRIVEKLDDKQELASILINIGVVYFDLKKADDAIEYYNKALKSAEENKDTLNMIRSLNNIGNALMTLKEDFKGSVYYFERTVELGKKIGFEAAVKVGLTNLTQIYTNTNQLDKATKTAKEVLKIAPDGDYGNYNMANIFRMRQQPDSAIKYMLFTQKLKWIEPQFKMVVLKDLSDIYAEKEAYKKALEYFREYSQLKDSLHNKEAEKNIMEIKTRYEAEKKDLEIQQLSLINSRRRSIIILISVLGIFVLGIAILVNRNIRKKRALDVKDLELKELQISELKKDKLIIASTAAIKGEEIERSRLARDLHDGLGGLLTGLKLNMNDMKNHVILDEATQNMFNNALKLLDSSIAEMHLVANNMMPEILIRMGLHQALDNFIKKLVDSEQIELNFQFFGYDMRFDPNFELTVYRGVQEIINNALKHSGASKVFVQLVSEVNRLCATINDNGKGFDPSVISAKGNGLSNIKTRISAFNGRFDISSTIDEGTEVVIEFNELENYIIHDTSIDC